MSKEDKTKVESPWMKTTEIAEYLSVSAGTVRNWVSAHYIPFVRRGRVVRFHRAEIDKWLRIDSCPGRSTVTAR